MRRLTFSEAHPEVMLPDGRTVRWMTTQPHPGVLEGWKPMKTHGADAGQIGWRLHAVPLTDAEYTAFRYDEAGYRRPKALCGMSPAHGWGLDLFIDGECERCAKRLERLSAPLSVLSSR